jgi:hypothetical protein
MTPVKTSMFALFLALCAAGCAHTTSHKDWAQWSKLQIQYPDHGTLSPVYFIDVARQYLDVHHITVDAEQPIVDVYVCTPDKMGLVKFRQGAEHVCAVEIGPEGKAVRHHDIRVTR